MAKAKPRYYVTKKEREAWIKTRALLSSDDVEIFVFEDRDEWLDFRGKSFGGSDISAFLDPKAYSSACDIVARKKGLDTSNSKQTIPQRRGHCLEPLIADLYKEKSGDEILHMHDVNVVVKNKKYPLLAASLDGIVVPADGSGNYKIFEAKSVSGKGAYKFFDGIPYMYRLQMQLYMMVCELDSTIAGILIDDNYYDLEEPADLEMQQLIDKTTQDIWNRFVLTDEMPEPRDLADYKKWCTKTCFGEIRDASVEMCLKILEWQNAKDALNDFASAKSDLESKINEYEFAIRKFIGTAEFLNYGDIEVATCKLIKTGSKRLVMKKDAVEKLQQVLANAMVHPKPSPEYEPEQPAELVVTGADDGEFELF